jgi:hypothetical protein
VRKTMKTEGLTETALIAHANRTRNFSVEAEYHQISRRAWDALCKEREDANAPRPSSLEKSSFFSGKPLRSIEVHPEVIPAPDTPETAAVNAQKQMADAIADGVARAVLAVEQARNSGQQRK